MPPSIYIVTQADYVDYEAEENDQQEYGIVSCHTSEEAANDAAEIQAREACIMEDDDEREGREDHSNKYRPGCFDSTFRMAYHPDLFSIRIRVEKNTLFGKLSLIKPLPKTTATKADVSYQPRYGQLANVPVNSKPNGLRGAKVSIVGALESMQSQNARRAIEILGGSVPNSLINADYIVMGTIGKETHIFEHYELKLPGLGQKLDEKGFWQLMVDGVPDDQVLKVFDAEIDKTARHALYGTSDSSDAEEDDGSEDEEGDEDEDDEDEDGVEPPAKKQKI